MKDMMPEVILLSHDARYPVDVVAVVNEAFRALLGSKTIATKEAPTRGKNNNCIRIVRECVQAHGGELVIGWSVCTDLQLRLPQNNCFAGHALNVHGSWKPAQSE